jgi:uncharacterized protein YbjQ (UPF0145 family)
MSDEAMTSTTFDLPGYTVEATYAMCWGVFVRSVGFAKGFTGSFKALATGDVTQHTNVVDEARKEAVERLMAHARSLGGNAVLGVRFDSSDMGNGLAEILADGTAVTVNPA